MNQYINNEIESLENINQSYDKNQTDNNKDDIARIKGLVNILNEASKAYYQEGREIMSNLAFDEMYDELEALEKKTGIVLSNSPTVNVGYEVLSELPKEKHSEPMLSLNKTKSVDELADFLGDKKGVLSWKLDGLTVVLTYDEGKLVKAVTRGTGEVGEVITENAKKFKNIPLNIKYKGKLIVRGEAIIKYSDFEKINDSIGDEKEKYKNPRNLCSGSVRQLDSRITAERNVNFYAFTLVHVDKDMNNSVKYQMEWLEKQGFDAVENYFVTGEDIAERVDFFSEKIKTYDLPSDGLVLMYDDIEYGLSLGRTAKFPRNGLAFKWRDEIKKTTLLDIEWSASRTGLINPVAIFESVELEGTTVSRASIHNVSIAENLMLGIGDTIEVYKANMIIPQIASNLTKSGLKKVPETCPVCGGKTVIKEDNGFKFLYCINEECPAKQINRFSNFVSRGAMDIRGISKETLEKFIDNGYIKKLGDIYRLNNYRDQIISDKGFGEKSLENFVTSAEAARNREDYRVLAGLGITGVGLTNARMITAGVMEKLDDYPGLKAEDFIKVDGVGPVIAEAIEKYFNKEKNKDEFYDLLKEVNVIYSNAEAVVGIEPGERTTFEAGTMSLVGMTDGETKISAAENMIKGKTFVVTGSLNHFENRDALKDYIFKMGGKVTGSVSKKTDYLINNDNMSMSSKNKKAKELEIPIITEEDFINMAKYK